MDTSDSLQQKKTSFESINKEVKSLMREGYSATQILSQVKPSIISQQSTQFANVLPQLHDVVILHPTLTGRQKSLCALVFAEADKALCDGADEELWILEAGLRIHKAIS